MRHLTAMLIGAQLHTDNDVWHSGNGNNNCCNKNKSSIKVRDDIGLGRRFALMRIMQIWNHALRSTIQQLKLNCINMKCASSTTESQSLPQSRSRKVECEKWSDKLVQTLAKNFQLCREGHKLCMASGLQILWIVGGGRGGSLGLVLY